MNWYPPFWGAGVRVSEVNPSCTRYVTTMKLRWWNKNIYGTHFGGSLYAMCDPFYCFIVYNHLGKDYIVWDKAASIEFVSPGKSKVTAIFEADERTLSDFKTKVDLEGKATIEFTTTVRGIDDKIVAKVQKTVYARRKNSIK